MRAFAVGNLSVPLSTLGDAGKHHQNQGEKMTDDNRVLIAVLLDRSGSMSSIKTDTEGGFAAFIDQQRGLNRDVRVTLAQFDTEYDVVYADRPLADVPPLALEPRGATALYDAIGRLVSDVGAELAAQPEEERPGAVIVVVLTDGHENSSREWTHRPSVRRSAGRKVSIRGRSCSSEPIWMPWQSGGTWASRPTPR